MCRSQFPSEHWMLQVTGPSASHSAGLFGGYLPVHRSRGEAIAENSAANDVTQIINSFGTVVGYHQS